MNRKQNSFGVFFLIFMTYCLQVRSQNSCPLNIDVELGNFTNWQCYDGTVAVLGNINVINVNPGIPLANRHQVYSNTGNTALDQYGLFPVKCPNGSGYSIKLGNNSGGRFAERVSYSFTIPANADQYTLLYWYAVVFQNPNHNVQEQPRFIANVFDETVNNFIPCASFTYVGSGGLPGFEQSTVNNQVIYKSWTPVTVNLSGLAGHTIRIEFTTADCTEGGHFGYAYIDVNSECSQPVQGATYCLGAQNITLTAPFGYQNYSWYNANFSQTIGNSQTLILNPPPPDSTLLAVVVRPYTGYGCVDTIFTRIMARPTPIANAGIDQTTCQNIPVQLGEATSTNWVYQWQPSNGLSNPMGSITLATPLTTTLYILNVTDLASGCSKSDTVLVNVVAIDNKLSVIGDTIVCGNQPINIVLSVNPVSMLQWYKNNILIPGATNDTILVNDTGIYYAILRENSCVVETRHFTIGRFAVPNAAFTINAATQCFPSHNIIVNAIGDSPQYRWNWGDGSTSIGKNAQHRYAVSGNYTIRLTVKNSAGCIDTTETIVQIKAVPIANFIVESSCVNTVVQLQNTTSYSGNNVLSYSWDFSNGYTANGITPSYQYSTAGNYIIKLSVKSPECPADSSIIRKIVTIQKPQANKSVTINAVTNQQTVIHTINKGVNYYWQPANYLNSTSSANPIFTGSQNTQYFVAVKNQAGCVNNDTVNVKVFKEAAIWVPTAFTPNNDGLNDHIYPILIGIKELTYFRIWNRWGQLIFETTTQAAGWNGKFNGELQPSSNFVWMVVAITADGRQLSQKGNVILIR